MPSSCAAITTSSPIISANRLSLLKRNSADIPFRLRLTIAAPVPIPAPTAQAPGVVSPGSASSRGRHSWPAADLRLAVADCPESVLKAPVLAKKRHVPDSQIKSRYAVLRVNNRLRLGFAGAAQMQHEHWRESRYIPALNGKRRDEYRIGIGHFSHPLPWQDVAPRNVSRTLSFIRNPVWSASFAGMVSQTPLLFPSH